MIEFFNKKARQIAENKFNQEKQNKQNFNKDNMVKQLKIKFSEILSKNPVKFQASSVDIEPKEDRAFDSVEWIPQDKPNHRTSIHFKENKDFIGVNTNGNFYVSDSLDNYKIDNESFHTLLTIMEELIRETDYPESEKTKMLTGTINGLKEITSENIK